MRLLLVHDQQEDPGPRARHLANAGFEVKLCGSADECRTLVAERRPHVLLMDVLIKGTNGFELTRELRQLYTAEELPIILCSFVYRTRQYREEAWEAGAQCYLLKPIEPQRLVQNVHSVISTAKGIDTDADAPAPAGQA